MFQRLVLGAMAVAGATAAELRPVSGFGDNPTNIEMYEYVPDNLAESPAIIVNVSYAVPFVTLRRVIPALAAVLTLSRRCTGAAAKPLGGSKTTPN